jgi:hypothetical protein
LEEPFIIIIPALADNDPPTDKFPPIVKEVFVVTEPLIVRSLKTIFVPVIDFAAPVIVIKPPDACVNWPAALVEIFPETLSIVPVAAVIPEPMKLILLKFCVPEPLMVEEGPLNIIVLVFPVKVPLLTQFPPML